MVDFDRKCESLFDAARHATDPTAEDDARIRRALAAKVGGAVIGLSTGSSAVAQGAAKGALAGAMTKGLQATLLWKVIPLSMVVAVGAGAVVIESRPGSKHEPAHATSVVDAPPPIDPSPPEPSQVAPSSETSLPDEMPIERGGTRPVARSVPRSVESHPRSVETNLEAPPTRGTEGSLPTVSLNSAPSAESRNQPPAIASSSLGSEVALLSRMHEAWQVGDSTALEREIAEHERRFPRGVLSEEREAMKTMLACRRADPEHARRLGAEFAAQHPSSPHIARVASICTAARR